MKFVQSLWRVAIERCTNGLNLIRIDSSLTMLINVRRCYISLELQFRIVTSRGFYFLLFFSLLSFFRFVFKVVFGGISCCTARVRAHTWPSRVTFRVPARLISFERSARNFYFVRYAWTVERRSGTASLNSFSLFSFAATRRKWILWKSVSMIPESE